MTKTSSTSPTQLPPSTWPAPSRQPAPSTQLPPSTHRSVAFVESPLQFLSALEAHEPGETMLIRARATARGMTSFLDAFDPDWLPAGVRYEREGAKPGVLRKQNPTRILLGDACSGQIHKALALAYLERRLPEVVILDDGLATYSAIETLTAARGPLVRARQTLKSSRMIMAAHIADRLRGLAHSGKLRWHTALPVHSTTRTSFLKTGAEITRHRFERLQALPTGGDHARDTPVIGSSMVADGLIRESTYRDWLEGILEGGPITYYPHRRETDDFLASLAPDDRIRIKHVGLPIELRLINLPAGSTIRSLPSTAAVSLAVLNPDVRIEVTEVPAQWWTGTAPGSLRQTLNSHTVRVDAHS